MGKVERLTIGNSLDMDDLPIGSITRSNGFIYTYGMISVDPESGEVVEGDVQSQTRQVLDNLRLVLETVDATFDDIVMVHIFLNDIRTDFDAFNEVYGEYFPSDPPTRYCVGATLAWPELKVEIHMVAAE